jgi:hypothetical protein
LFVRKENEVKQKLIFTNTDGGLAQPSKTTSQKPKLYNILTLINQDVIPVANVLVGGGGGGVTNYRPGVKLAGGERRLRH